MDTLSTQPAFLIHHDGELGDIRDLLEELGAEFEERLGLGPMAGREDASEFDFIIATPRRILHVPTPELGRRPRMIAILEGDSKTLRAHLRRVSIDMLVRRPVHPAALRLLLLHAMYRGPERRRRERVPIGAIVRYRTGLVRRSATLADLSVRGCRLLLGRRLEADRKIKITIPSGLTGEKSLVVHGHVLRCDGENQTPENVFVTAIRFAEVDLALSRRLLALIDRHRDGPARLPVGTEPAGRPSRSNTSCAAAASAGAELSGAPPGTNGDDAFDVAAGSETADSSRDRRRAERHRYGKRVVALGEEATRVLLGRDISTGGMRIDPNPDLQVGQRFQIALHAASRSEPMVVAACVRRDDGEAGLVLGFELGDDARRQELETLLEQLPVLEAREGSEEETGVIISQILEQRATA